MWHAADNENFTPKKEELVLAILELKPNSKSEIFRQIGICKYISIDQWQVVCFCGEDTDIENIDGITHWAKVPELPEIN
jgi:hypothetical protein